MKRRVAFLILTVLLVSVPVVIVQNHLIPTEKPNLSRQEAKVARHKGREDHEFFRLRDPKLNAIPAGIRMKELAFGKEQAERAKTNPSVDVIAATYAPWVNAGPVDVGGRIRALEIDLNGNYIIAGGVHGGIWKSSDDGLTWQLKTDAFENPSITSVAQDPTTPSVWYAVMGEYNGSLSNRDDAAKAYGSGYYRSADHGETWTFNLMAADAFPSVQNSNVNFIAKAKVDAQGTLWCATNLYGVIRKKKTATKFELVRANGSRLETQYNYHRWTDIDFNETFGWVVVYSNDTRGVSNTASPAGIFFSENPTLSTPVWVDLTPASLNRNSIGRSLVKFAKSADVFYVFIQLYGSTSVSLFKYTYNSTSKAYVVSSRNAIVNAIPREPDEIGTPAFGINTQQEYNMVLAVDPTRADAVFLGGTTMYRSNDGFSTATGYTRIGGYLNAEDYSQWPNHHSDQHALVFNPKNKLIAYSAHDGGISRTDNVFAETVSWTNRDNGLVITQYYHVAISKGVTDKDILGGAQDNGSPVFEFTSPTATSSEDVSSGDGAFQFLGKTVAFTSSQQGNISLVEKSTFSYKDIKPTYTSDPLFIHPFAVDPNNDSDIYIPDGADIAFQRGLATKTQAQIDAGWQKLTLNVSAKDSKRITAIALSDETPQRIVYSGLTDLTLGTALPSVVRFNAETNVQAETELPSAAPGSYVNAIAVNPKNGNELLVAISNYSVPSLYYSSNGGQSFSMVEGSLANSDISFRSATIVNIGAQKVYFVGTSVGVWWTTQISGTTTSWKFYTDGALGFNVVEWLDSRDSDYRVVAATHGRGVFVLDARRTVSNDRENSNLAQKFELSQNFPNPFNPSTTIRYSLAESQPIELSVFDSQGRLISTLVNGVKPSGAHQITFDASHLSSGTYIYRLTSGKSVQTKKMVLLK